MSVLGDSCGYEIRKRNGGILFAHRRTRGPLLVAAITAGLSLLALVNGAVWVRESWTVIAVLGPLALLFAAIALVAYRAWKRRRLAPFESFVSLRANLKSQYLQRGGRDLAPLAEVEVDTPRNLGDSTQGSMRWIRLRWPGGKALVYSAASRGSEDLAAILKHSFAGDSQAKVG